MMVLLFWLVFGHALADYPLQGQFLSDAKRPGGTPLAWWIALTWHALIHAGVVALLTSSIELGFCEFAMHWWIDFNKTRNVINDTTDQALHVACKIAWAILA